MRTILDVTGADITNAFLALALQTNEIFQQDLFAISTPYKQQGGIAINPYVFLLTPLEGPFNWPPIVNLSSQTYPISEQFIPASIKREAISFETGLAAQDFRLRWNSIPANGVTIDHGNNNLTLPIIEHFRQGAFDNGCVRVWRMFASDYGGGTFRGVAKWTMGRIADTSIDPGGVSITVKSYLDQLDRQVPKYLIEAANRVNTLGLYQSRNSQGVVGTPDTLQTTANAQNTVNHIAFVDSSSPGHLFPEGTFDGMYYVIFTQGLGRIQHSYNDGLLNWLVLLDPLEATPPSVGFNLQLTIYKSQPIDNQGSASGSISLPGFPFLPRPEDQF